MITHRPSGPIVDIPSIQSAFRDLEIERLQVLAALNIILAKAPAGEFRMVLVDENGNPAQYKMIAGAGMTITPNAVAKTVTFTSP